MQDSKAKGIFWGIGPHTSQADFMRVAVEGIFYSLRQIAKSLLSDMKGTITLIGGGAKNRTWCQILADITNQIVMVPENSKYLPAVGIASTAFYYLGWITKVLSMTISTVKKFICTFRIRTTKLSIMKGIINI
ncbi:FGGY-family carbohydrate kinase [Alteribacillus sp. JSM 102045]|uniref:FGGY-family carbohydrate kinase n=1 Tax=Alteribacillus sp. JSM 102045 TaxID=1562101 RepID=UPI0035BF026C